MTDRRRHVVASFVGLLAAATFATACGNDSPAASGVADVPITSADGATVSLSEMEGTPLVVNMWATWCSPCVREMPAFDEVAADSGDVRIVGVNVGDTSDDAAAFAKDLGITYEQFTDPDGALSTALAVTGLPATAFIGADGKVVAVHQGAFTAPELRDAIIQNFPDPDGGTTS